MSDHDENDSSPFASLKENIESADEGQEPILKLDKILASIDPSVEEKRREPRFKYNRKAVMYDPASGQPIYAKSKDLSKVGVCMVAQMGSYKIGEVYYAESIGNQHYPSMTLKLKLVRVINNEKENESMLGFEIIESKDSNLEYNINKLNQR